MGMGRSVESRGQLEQEIWGECGRHNVAVIMPYLEYLVAGTVERYLVFHEPWSHPRSMENCRRVGRRVRKGSEQQWWQIGTRIKMVGVQLEVNDSMKDEIRSGKAVETNLFFLEGILA